MDRAIKIGDILGKKEKNWIEIRDNIKEEIEKKICFYWRFKFNSFT